MAKGKRRKERLRALKLAARGDDVAMDGTSGPVDSAPPLTGLTAFAPTFATESRATEDEATTTTTTTFSSDIVREKRRRRFERRSPSARRERWTARCPTPSVEASRRIEKIEKVRALRR